MIYGGTLKIESMAGTSESIRKDFFNMDTSHPQFKQMMTLFNQSGKVGHRHTYAYNASKGRTESTKDLTEAEVLAVIAELKPLVPETKFTPKPGDKQRKKIIGIARDMRWDSPTPNPSPAGRGDKKLLMKRIDDFMLTRTKYKKKLNDLTVDELNKVCFTFEQDVKSSFLSGLNR